MHCTRCGTELPKDASFCYKCGSPVGHDSHITASDITAAPKVSIEQEYLELGQSFWQAGNYKEANACFSRVLEENPHSRDAWFWKGITVAMRGSIAEADTYWRKSAFTIEETIDYLATATKGLSWDVGSVLISIGRKVIGYWGIILLEAALKGDPGKREQVASSYIELARQLGRQAADGNVGQLDEAVSCLERVLQIDPDQKGEVAAGYIELASQTGYLTGQFDIAVSHLERALQLDPGSKEQVAGGYISLARPAGKAGRFDLAVSYLEQALQLDPGQKNKVAGDSFKGYIGLAGLAGEAGRFEIAVSYLEQALQLDSGSRGEVAGGWRVGYIGLAELACEAGRRDLAKTYLKRCARLGYKGSAKKMAEKLKIRLGWF